MAWLAVFKDYVPLFQTLIWAFLIIFGFSLFRKQLNLILESIHQRITGVAGGGSIKANFGMISFEFGEDLRNLPTTDEVTSTKENTIVSRWTEKRKQICENNRCIFLSHVFTPSETSSNQQFKFFIFLTINPGIITPRVKSSSIEDIDYAEFFLGQAWGDRIFKIQNEGNLVGLSIIAHGSFLVICHVVFKNGSDAIIDSYIDFELAKRIVKDGGESK